MRRLAIAALALATTPALAQPRNPGPPPGYADDQAYAEDDRGPPPRDDERAEHMLGQAGRLADPATASAVASAMTAMSDAFLDLPIDRIRAAMAPYDRHYDPRGPRTLGELVERDDPHFRERLHDDAERAVRGAGRAARTASEVEPELRAAADQFARRLEAAIARAERPD